jgi:hypothetical protein
MHTKVARKSNFYFFMRDYLTKQAAVMTFVALVASPVFATPARTVSFPAAASSAHVISLGTALDPASGEVVEGFAFLHPAKGFAHKGAVHKGPGGGGSQCYAFFASGARWKGTEDYLVNPANIAGLAETDVRALMAASLETWDTQVAFDVFGVEVAGIVDGADT